MNICYTCGTYVNIFDLGNSDSSFGASSSFQHSKRRHYKRLEFVEHILGTLIESRYGYENPHVRIGEPTVMIGHSQMFANVRLLTAAEIEAHLELPLALANGSWPINGFGSGFSPTLFWAKARDVWESLIRRLKPTAILRTQNEHSLMPRGSPTFLGRIFPVANGDTY